MSGRSVASRRVKTSTFEAAFAEPPRQLGDVDVQAAGVSDARRGEWRRVHADHGHSLWIFDACAHLDLR